MGYFKNRRLKKELAVSTDEELIKSFRFCVVLYYLEPNQSLYEAIQAVLTEIHSRSNKCNKMLLEEMEMLCNNRIITPFFVLQESICYELGRVDTMELLYCQIHTNNLRNWIKFTYANNLGTEISNRITDEDIDKMEVRIREVYQALGPR